ncbi:cyd operon protein YbgT [Burkholderia humptydooensis MSMB43]|uniref:Cyd operon protein YbgT n=1 Tax=Burkholderia humptydooensis MSMB43 TaxID=441157 RepID=A0ABN0GC72_9BURK|nr:cyd operon protein YbgT [Burkholderia humptydooensis MSMB43]
MRRTARPALSHDFRKFRRSRIMWYFSWILGIGVALAFGIINAMWLEARQKRDA